MKEYLEVEITDGLFVCGEKNRVVFKIDRDEYPDQHKIGRTYNNVGICHVAGVLEEIILDVWPGLEPKAATGLASDCTEYYDKELDSNGYLTLHGNNFGIDAPTRNHERAFVLNKRKAQDLLFDIANIKRKNQD